MKNKRTIRKTQNAKRKKTRLIKKAGFWRSDPLKRFIKKEIRRTRPLHKKILLHPLSFMVLLCAGVFISLWTNQVIANVQVSVTVEAPPLVAGAVISYPLNNANISNRLITVHGTCPQDSYVKLYDNDIFSGAAWCINGAFDIQLDLFVGKNVLMAYAYNYTDRLGPVTPAVIATYVSPDTGSSLASGQVLAPKPPLLLMTDFSYQTVGTGNDFSWTITLEGGQSPYVFQTDWGDNTTDKQVFDDKPTVTLTHKYEEPGYYEIIARASDATGSTRTLQMATLVLGANSASLRSTTQGSGIVGASSPNDKITDFMVDTKEWLWLVWPAFFIIALMAIAFWLGEKRACIAMLNRKRLRFKHSVH